MHRSDVSRAIGRKSIGGAVELRGQRESARGWDPSVARASEVLWSSERDNPDKAERISFVARASEVLWSSEKLRP